MMKNPKKILALILSMTMIVSMVPAHAEGTEEEHGTGLQEMTAERRKELLKHAALYPADVIIPDNNINSTQANDVTSVDNSNSIYFPSIANQGSDNSCVAYATTYYQLTYTVSRALNSSYSNYTFAPNWTYSLINSGTDNGSNEDDAYKIINDFGAPKQTEFTGSKTNIETHANVWKSAMRYKLDSGEDNQWSFHYFDNTDDFIVSAKQQLASGKILTTGSNSSRWYGDDSSESVTARVGSSNQKGIAYVKNSGSEGRHLITIVGYNDDVQFTFNGHTTYGGFKIANSWGTSWGNSGYIWVAYDAFYEQSSNRPSSNNGSGFISSWWNEGTDENVFYTIDLDDNYSLYEPSYVGEFTLASKKLCDTKLTYKTKETANSNFSSENNIFDGSDYDGLPTSRTYSGTLALDLSDMSDYMTGDVNYWEIYLEGISTGTLRILDASGDAVLASQSGIRWVKPHEHIYEQGAVTINNSTWTRTDTCTICGHTKNVTGTCYFNMDFESGVTSSSWGNNGRGIISSVTYGDNTYMKVDYENESNTAPRYFEVFSPSSGAYSPLNISGNIEMSFDVMFTGNDADVYLKRRAEDINDIVLRIACKEGGRLQYGTNGGRGTFYDSNHDYVNPLSRWLHVRIVANISTDEEVAKQSIYVTDRDTGELVTSVENIALTTNVPKCNLFMIGGSSTVNIDNILVRNIL